MTQPTENTERNAAHTVELHPEETPSEAVVSAMAVVTSQSPLEMESLAAVTDPDALNTFISATEENPSSVTATFDYCGYHVLVTPSRIHIDR